MTDSAKQVAIEYTVFLEDGTEVDSNVGGEPLQFERGKEEILPGLEEAIAELSVGEQKRVTLPPERAYGPRREDVLEEVEVDAIPEAARHEGAMLIAEDGQGNRRQLRVHEVRGDRAVLDFNHPLAGRTLTFEVKVLEIR